MDIQRRESLLSAYPSLVEDALLSAKTCAAALEISESTWWAWVSDPDFPVRPVRFGERFTRFRRSALSAWIESLPPGGAKPSPNPRCKPAQAVEGRGANRAL
jgi:predicted DNA-binding transcriptional regulator AlpA